MKAHRDAGSLRGQNAGPCQNREILAERGERRGEDGDCHEKLHEGPSVQSQILAAVWTTSSSFLHWSSGVSGFPASVLAKPH